MKRYVILLSFLFSLAALSAFSQVEICNNNLDDDGDGLVDCRDGNCAGKVCEVCDNEVDDDGDGYIDCYDKECFNSTECKDFFLGRDAKCEVVPDSFPPFQMKLKYKSEINRANHIARLIAGDIDSDGTPELLTGFSVTDGYNDNGDNPTASGISIFQAPGSGGSLDSKPYIDLLADGLTAGYEDLCMADIDRDGCAEIFVVTRSLKDGDPYEVHAYHCDGTKVWTGATTKISLPRDPGVLGLADFDGDGLVELYTRTQIYDAHTGRKLGENNIDNVNTGIHNGVNKGWSMNSGAPIAVDIDNATPGLELIAGCRIYSVTINRATMTATLTLTKERPEYATRTGNTKGNGTSVADFNLDGFLDVLAVGSYNAYDDNTTIFFWDVQNNTLKTFNDPIGSGDYAKGWKNGAGRINIADIDGDNLMNAVYVSGKYLYALKDSTSSTNLALLWRQDVVEETSGITGCTMFDFNADGKSEIVYRDEDYIYIYTTDINGKVTRSTPERCSSRTFNEYPIVLDMDADGASEICIICSTTTTTNGKNLKRWDPAEVRVYESANIPWVPARRLWNQHGYFVVNVNDDLTIPQNQQLHHLIYGTNVKCRDDDPKTSRPLNSFLNQSPYLNSVGCPSFPTPDLAMVNFSDTQTFDFTPPVCPERNFNVTFKFTNAGDIGISGTIPVTLYNGDPRSGATSSTKLGTTTVTVGNMLPGDTLTATLPVTGPGSQFTLYVVINDDGTTMPLDLESQKGNFKECLYNNLLQADVVPLPATLSTNTKINEKCSPASPDNGAAFAYVVNGPAKDSTAFNYYWSNGTVAKPIATVDYTGHAYTALPAGDYTVYAIHKVAGCGSDTTTVNITEQSNQFTVSITKNSDNEKCLTPNGELEVTVNDVDGDGNPEPAVNYEFYWYKGATPLTGDTLSIAPIAGNLPEGDYSVFVIDKATRCGASDNENILPIYSAPVISTSDVDITCTSGNTGSITATEGSAPAITSQFNWFNGAFVKPTADYAVTTGTTATINNLAAGSYTVFARNPDSNCNSDTITVTITQSTAPTNVVASKIDDQLSCTAKNGSASVTFDDIANVASYTIQWYIGANTLATNELPDAQGGKTLTATGLASGVYTVKVTNADGCSATDDITIDGPVPVNIIDIIGSPQFNCFPNDGTITVQSVSPYPIGDFTFEWYRGASVTAANRIAGANTATLTNVTPGQIYTVRARHIQHNCYTPARQASIISNTPAIAIGNISRLLPTDCRSENGRISIDVTSVPLSTYTFQWFVGGAATGTPLSGKTSSTLTSSTVIDIATGTYTVRVSDISSSCFRDFPVNLGFQNGHLIDTLNHMDILTCDPSNGSITGLLTPAPLTNDTHYDVVWFTGSLDPGTAAATGTNAPNTGVNQFTGTVPTDTIYTMVAIVNASATAINPNLVGCRASTTFIIDRITTPPSIDAVATAATIVENKSCLDASFVNGSGAINLTLDGGAVPSEYNYLWTSADHPTFNETSQNISGLSPGVYKIVVTDNTGANLGCTAENEFTILDDPQVIEVNMAAGDFTISAITNCDPVTGLPLTNGQAAFTRITIDGNAMLPPFNDPLNDLVFLWSHPDNDLTTDWEIASLPAGEYAVTVTNANSNCNITQSFVIENETINTAQLALIDFTRATQCLQPDTNGELVVVASSADPTHTFTFNWFDGPDSTFPAVGAPNSVVNTPTQSTLVSPNGGTYTARVTSSNDCFVEEDFVIERIPSPLVLNVTASPNTFCVNPNGAVFARIANTDANGNIFPASAYTFEWRSVTSGLVGDEQFENSFIEDTYEVRVFETNDAACEVIETIVVEPLKVLPNPTAQSLAPNTICDLVNGVPNGVVSASVDGDVISYTFSWTNSSNAPIGNGSIISQLPQDTYTVIATNTVTGCEGTTQTTIEAPPVIADFIPTIEILAHVTSCIEDNGAMAVSVIDEITQEENTQDYIFFWYDALPPVPSIPEDPGNNVTNMGETYDSLKANNPYYVIAQDRFTGCISIPVNETLEFQPIYPKFTIDLVASTCEVNNANDPALGDPNGEVYLTVTNNVAIGEIIWERLNSTDQFPSDAALQGIYAGEYKVTVITQLGCSYDSTFILKRDVHPFNGISRNDDGKNDYFHINCIEEFPGNIVRIYNRAGSLVYEERDYDNLTIYFDGRSNKGITPMGNNLPDGTYFYVIDKRDGSKPIAGYLEIVN